MSETNIELARRGWEAARRGDYDLIASLLDPEVKWHGGDPSAKESCQNRAQALQRMQQGRRPVPELVDIRESGDRVVLILKPQTVEGEEPVLTANVTTFRDGTVVEMVHFDRATDALATLGLSS